MSRDQSLCFSLLQGISGETEQLSTALLCLCQGVGYVLKMNNLWDLDNYRTGGDAHTVTRMM